ncbi:hypothetical protein [Gorillibacterium sp. sgz5001074]|uniref:hypothetical protein n=1 Tax=Gorillibacterium sp. sgz5001074 TaxID=3446695 RepID=UPI003F662D13
MKIVFTEHAKKRCREREVDGMYIRNQLHFVPHQKGEHKWYIPNTGLFVTYVDQGQNIRTVITVGKNIEGGWDGEKQSVAKLRKA